MANGFLGLFRSGPSSVKLADGEVLFKKGDAAKHLYIVEKGELEVLDGDDVLATLGEGEIVGEMALVDGGTRSATVRAKSRSIVVPVDEKQFLRMVQETPFFAIRVMRVMCARLRAMDAAIAHH